MSVFECTGQDQKFADKGVGPGKAERGQGEKGEKGHVPGHVFADTGSNAQLTAVGPLVDHADAEEEGTGGDAVVDHLHDRALQPPGDSG